MSAETFRAIWSMAKPGAKATRFLESLRFLTEKARDGAIHVIFFAFTLPEQSEAMHQERLDWECQSFE